MNLISALFLGVLQGLTEFLPVSSSGHLVLVQSLLPGFSQPGVLFDVLLHFGTLLAIVFFFRSEIMKLNSKYLYFLILGTIPAVIVGFLFQPLLESVFSSVKLVGFALLVTGVFNLLADRVNSGKKKMGFGSSFVVGLSQALAIIPGISRSGLTIFAGLGLGIDRKKAAQFSFLLSIPAVLGANILQFLTHGLDGIGSPFFYLVGFLSAFVSGVIAIKLVFRFLLAKNFTVFALYCFLLGLAVIIL